MIKAKIYYHDIGDYLSREEKLAIIKKNRSITNMQWQTLTPNEHGDWLNQRNDAFSSFIPLEPEKKFDVKAKSFFLAQSNGIASGKDAWAYNSSSENLVSNLNKMIDFYNNQRLEFAKKKKENPNLTIEKFVDYDSTKISWSDIFLRDASKNLEYKFDKNKIAIGLYRPFFYKNLLMIKQ
jgi:predicted helicase